MKRASVRGLIVAGCALALGSVVGIAPASSSSIAFAPAQQFPTGSFIGPGPGATTTVAADVDGDGDTDVVVTDWFGNGPLVLRNSGNGTFGAPEPIAGAGDIGALATGDLNGDGRPDLVGRDANGVVVLLGNGDGTFRQGERVAVSANAQQSVSVLDANGDGHLDIATPE